MPHMAELPEGTVFAGHRIDGVAGRGGMGVVYRATHLALDHVVALKVIAPELADDPRFRERFVRESRTAVSIRHPNVVQVRHAGEENGVLFVTMDYVEGSDLRALISPERRIEPVRGALIISQVAAALDAAHERGLVHRDVKPGNVLIEERDGDEHVYLTDFGLTKRMSGATELTASGAFIGTLEYMAPEQIRGGELDARTDVYALGGVAFATLTGEPLFGRVEGDVAKLYAHLNDPVPRASERWPALPVAVDPVLQRAMAKKPDDRYASAGEFARALEDVAIGPGPGFEPTVTSPVAVPFEPTEEATEETQPAEPSTVAAPAGPSPATPPPQGRRRLLGALAGLAVVGAVVGVVAIVGGGEEGGAGGGEATIGDPIDVGESTLGVAAKAGTVLVADRGADSVGVVDETDGKLRTVPAGGAAPESVFAGEPIVWVANAGGSVARFQLTGGRLSREVTAPTIELGGTPQDVAVANQAAWVTNATEDSVTRIDPSTGQVATDPIEVGRVPYGVAVDPDNPDIVFVVNGETDDVSVIDRKSRTDVEAGSVIETVPVGDRPKAVAVDFGFAWVTNRDSDSISRITATDPFDAATIDGVCEQPREVDTGFGAVWVSCAGREVARIDPGSGDATRIDLGDVEGSPEGIAVGTDAVWVAMGDAGTVVPITPEG
jgi:streptogramin lyase